MKQNKLSVTEMSGTRNICEAPFLSYPLSSVWYFTYRFLWIDQQHLFDRLGSLYFQFDEPITHIHNNIHIPLIMPLYHQMYHVSCHISHASSSKWDEAIARNFCPFDGCCGHYMVRNSWNRRIHPAIPRWSSCVLGPFLDILRIPSWWREFWIFRRTFQPIHSWTHSVPIPRYPPWSPPCRMPPEGSDRPA